MSIRYGTYHGIVHAMYDLRPAHHVQLFVTAVCRSTFGPDDIAYKGEFVTCIRCLGFMGTSAWHNINASPEESNDR